MQPTALSASNQSPRRDLSTPNVPKLSGDGGAADRVCYSPMLGPTQRLFPAEEKRETSAGGDRDAALATKRVFAHRFGVGFDLEPNRVPGIGPK